jgi:proline dehydrogenase
MPGETLDEALAAATGLQARGLGTILTHLGENVADRAEADAVARHYIEVLDRIHAAKLDCEVSVKLTQLGFDLDDAIARDHVARIAAHAARLGNRVWIDMEGSTYTGRTIELYRALRAAHGNVGLAVQTYLRRTQDDVESLIPLGAMVRLVKGAYREPASIAFQKREEVDASFLSLARRLLEADARAAGARGTFGTHDRKLIAAIEKIAADSGVPRAEFEFAMLYGIQRDEQVRLAHAGYRSRALISYGTYWFPWYMRRLAERPANVWFVVRSMVG